MAFPGNSVRCAKTENVTIHPRELEFRRIGTGLRHLLSIKGDLHEMEFPRLHLARDAWGKGYATEALGAIVGLARSLGVCRLYAVCHTDHERSRKVLERCGFAREGVLRAFMDFPNLTPRTPVDVFSYAVILTAP